MTINEYRHTLNKAVDEASTLARQRAEIDSKLSKLRHAIYALSNLLPDNERTIFQSELTELASQTGNLTDSIREVLKLAAQRNTFLTAAEVRDQLKTMGFDFSEYTSNPLASVNTTLRRFKFDEVETRKRNGTTEYRWVVQSSKRSAEGGEKT